MLIYYLFNILISLILLIPSAHSKSQIPLWQNITEQQVYALQSQRDVQANITIDQLPLTGVDLNKVLFSQPETNNTVILEKIESLLIHGVQTLILNIELINNIWLIKNTNLPFDQFCISLEHYFQMTNTNLKANIVSLLLNVSSTTTPQVKRNISPNILNIVGMSTNQTNSNIESLTANNNTILSTNVTEILSLSLKNFIYAPTDLLTDRLQGTTWNVTGYSTKNGWPTLSYFLFTAKKRLIITEITDNLYKPANGLIFNNKILSFQVGNDSLNCPTTVSDIKETSLIPWRYMLNSFTQNDIRQSIDCGYSPIISNEFNDTTIANISPLLQNSVLWSWGYNQPSVNHSKRKHSLEAYNCAVFNFNSNNNSHSWIVDNCYNKKPGLCRFQNDQFSWLITNRDFTYFDFDSYKGTRCPEHYKFSVPRTPLEQKALLLLIDDTDETTGSIWIDMNSISIEDCWVSGGPYASCPYRKALTRRHFARMLAPACACSFGILCIVFYLNLLRVPLHDNRLNWRKKLQKELDRTEGVPS